MFPGPWVCKDLNKAKMSKIASFVKKNAEIRDGKILKPLAYH